MKINNIFCIGRNYSEHAKELNNPIPTTPVVFLKPTSSLCFDNEFVILPKESKRVDHEVEVVLMVGKKGKNISKDMALDFISHIAIGIDFTARDLQDAAKKKGLPWSVAKGFDTFCGLGNLAPYDKKTEYSFELKLNGEQKQKGNTTDMIFSFEDIISYLSKIFTLNPGDLIFTGTPSGVGIIKENDQIEATLENLSKLSLKVLAK